MIDSIRLRIDLAYDGTDFAGWARQPGQRTVQAEVEEGLRTILRLDATPRVVCAGRTDTGVHARGQVAHVDIPTASLGDSPQASLAIGQVGFRLRAITPRDIAIRSVESAAAGFDARFSALWRRYRYRVCDEPSQIDPWRRRDTLIHSRPLNVDAMRAASAVLHGEHDFAAFCRRREGATTIRTIEQLDWARTSPAIVELTVVADAFCRSMVRSIVGAFLMVGDGTRDEAWLADYLEARTRGFDTKVVPPQGLVLDHIQYPADEELAARAELTRTRRELPDGD